MSSIILNPFQLLELNVISAQDLATVARSMRTYAVAWVHPDRKLSTRVDSNGRNNPTWNDKFVFRVDEEFLTSDTSGVMIEIYAVHWFKDVLVGRVRILVGNLVPPPSRPFRRQHQHGMRFAALQVRRPSGRPQGILNIGVAVLDSSMRSMPLYTQLSTSAVGYLELMGEQNLGHNNHNHHPQQHQQQHKNQQEVDQKQQQPKEILPTAAPKPELRRTKSDTSSIQGVKTLKRKVSFRMKPNSVINASEATSSVQLEKHGKKGSSSLPSSMVNAPAPASASALAFASPGRKGRKARVTSTPTGNKGSEVDTPATPNAQASNRSKWVQKGEIVMVNPNTLMANKKWVQKPEVAALSPNNNPVANKSSRWVSSAASSPNNIIVPTNKLSNLAPKNLALDFEATPGKPGKLYITESELGPSPSEVAAAAAAKMKHRIPPHQLINDGESSAVGAWSLVESEEGLQSKLERWRKELPPVYDRGEYSTVLPSIVNDNGASKLSSDTRAVGKRRHARRHTVGGAPRGGGLFSCVSNICGCECSIVCGQGSSAVQR